MVVLCAEAILGWENGVEIDDGVKEAGYVILAVSPFQLRLKF